MHEFVVEGTSLGSIESRVFVPDGQREPMPVLYLLHGRGGSASDWDAVMEHLAGEAADGRVEPIVAVAIDGPWSRRGHWWVDSSFSGDELLPPGLPVAQVVMRDLLPAVEHAFPIRADRSARTVAGASMGGSGAVRLGLSHPDVFGRVIALSPAAHMTEPPPDSNARRFGAFGRGRERFDAARYRELGYAAQIEEYRNGALGRHPLRIRIAAGDREPPASQEDPERDLAVEAARMHAILRRVPGIDADLRVYEGGHDAHLWETALIDALRR